MHWQEDRSGKIEPRDAVGRLSGQRVGYLGLTVNALPAVVPVPFGRLDGRVVIRAAPKGVLARSTAGSVVSFLACDVADDLSRGWSTTVTGVATQISAPAELAACAELGLPGSDDDIFLGISMDLVNGREYPMVDPLASD
jgi:nitroimidazol reductase NimA-like FMN-containing flavoprotein (pyridoxamine 5'-phosphate oxidase superfamily)